MSIAKVEREIAPGEAGRLDQIIRDMTGRSRSEIRGILHEGGVTLNGQPCSKAGQTLAPGDVIIVRHDPHRRYKEPPREVRNSAFGVVFEDEHLIVVDKAPGILSVPTDRGGERTLVEEVSDYLRRRKRGARAFAVHRLDQDTSGLLVLAKTKALAEALQDQFRIRKAEREYAVIVAGEMPLGARTFRTRMATNRRLHRYSVREGESGELAITHYEAVSVQAGTTYVRARLETGRRNQIRVHFSEAGHPVLGDRRYRPEQAQHPWWKWRRLALQAAELGFEHPVTGEPLRFAVPLPREFERFLRRGSTGDVEL
jgi:23S rRNA pseudouridine1911/1915/1917 synthase